MKEKWTLFVVLVIVAIFSICSCSGDDDDSEQPPLDHNDVISITVHDQSSGVAVVAIDYYYTQDNGSALIGAMPIDENGNWLAPGGFAPVSMNAGYGNAVIEMMYTGDDPVVSKEIEVFMFTFDYFESFYTENFPYSKTWMGD